MSEYFDSIQRTLNRYPADKIEICRDSVTEEFRSENIKDEFGYLIPTVVRRENGIIVGLFWYKDSLFHRSEKDENGENLPAVIFSDGRKAWYINGLTIRRV